jgi:hypothetical protein
MNLVDPQSGLSVDSPAFRERASRIQLSDDPDTATAQTVQEMCRQIEAASVDPLVRAISFQAVRSIRGGPLWVGTGIQPFSSPRVMAESCWWWCKHYLRFKHHGQMFEVWSDQLGDPRNKLQLLIAPDVLVRMAKLEGDCAIYTMMIGAMLSSLGVRWEICTAAVEPYQPEIFSHVWPRTVYPDGGREPLDASHGKYPGWQVPQCDIYRLKVWDSGGREVSNQTGRFEGLHAYRRSRRGMGAMVCCDENGQYYDDGSVAVAPPTTPGLTPQQIAALSACTCINGTCIESGNSCASPAAPASQITVPPQNTAAYTNLATSLIKGGFTLAELNAMPPGTVINPNGQIVRQAPGYAVTTGGIVASGTSTLGSSSSMLTVGALLIGGVFLMSMMKGGR